MNGEHKKCEFKNEMEARIWYMAHNYDGDPRRVNEGRFISDCKKKGLIEETDAAQRGTMPSASPNGI